MSKYTYEDYLKLGCNPVGYNKIVDGYVFGRTSLDLLLDKISDLEAKLAESEKRVKDLEFRNKNLEHSLSVAPNANASQRARIDELTKENKQLKQQLAEKRQDCVALDKAWNNLNNQLSIKNDEINELKQQLADTEAQNKRVLEKLDLIVRSNQELEKENELLAKTLKMTKFIEKEVSQDKISFCIEKLEKAKELLLEKLYDLYSKPSEIWDKYGDLYDVVVEGAVNGTIDNQIKQLKEGK